MRWLMVPALGLAMSACAGLDPSATTAQGGAPEEYGQAVDNAAPLSTEDARRLDRIMEPLVANMDHPIPMDQVHVTVMDQSAINAANGGGGDFYVSQGLLRKADEDHLRAIMAHEIAHADLGHVNKIQSVASGVNLGAAILGEVFPSAGQLAPVAGNLIVSSYGRTEESAADRHAVQIMRRAGYDGKELMIGALTWLRDTEGGSSGGFFATHPSTDDRIADLRDMR